MDTKICHRIPITTVLGAVAAGIPLAAPTDEPTREMPKEAPDDLRWRLKQLQRQDWPATIEIDPDLRRGYCLDQLLRILAAMALLDAGIGPTQAVTIARNNENTILAIMSATVGSGAEEQGPGTTRYGLLRLGILGQDPDPERMEILPISHATLTGLLKEHALGRASIIIDFGGLAERALDVCRSSESSNALTELDAVLTRGNREFQSGRGFQKFSGPSGDRYASPRRKKRQRPTRTSPSKVRPD